MRVHSGETSNIRIVPYLRGDYNMTQVVKAAQLKREKYKFIFCKSWEISRAFGDRKIRRKDKIP